MIEYSIISESGMKWVLMLAVRQMMTMCSTVCTICYQSCYLFIYLSNGKGNDRIAVVFRCFSPRPR